LVFLTAETQKGDADRFDVRRAAAPSPDGLGKNESRWFEGDSFLSMTSRRAVGLLRRPTRRTEALRFLRFSAVSFCRRFGAHARHNP